MVDKRKIIKSALRRGEMTIKQLYDVFDLYLNLTDRELSMLTTSEIKRFKELHQRAYKKLLGNKIKLDMGLKRQLLSCLISEEFELKNNELFNLEVLNYDDFTEEEIDEYFIILKKISN